MQNFSSKIIKLSCEKAFNYVVLLSSRPARSPIQICILSHLAPLCVTTFYFYFLFRKPRYIHVFVSEVSVEYPVECRCCILYYGIESSIHFFFFGCMWIFRRLLTVLISWAAFRQSGLDLGDFLSGFSSQGGRPLLHYNQSRRGYVIDTKT